MSVRSDLETIASNMWWSWSPRAQALFEALDPATWHTDHHSPQAALLAVSDDALNAAYGSGDGATQLAAVLEEREAYLNAATSWTKSHAPALANGRVAYFSAEFGMHESLPIYSGGLGVLAGDHIKTTSDLGIPFTGISLKYAEGYFRQRVDENGWQQESFPATDWKKTACERIFAEDGAPLQIAIPLADRKVFAEVYRVAVGRSELYLLDTDVAQNNEVDRAICRRLYGGDSSTRIRQEVVLGIGGVRLLRALKIEPTVYHLNEGHSGFACFELIREQVGLGHTFVDAIHWVRQRALFTTHTPVPAGHDRFDASAVTEALSYYQHRLGTSWHDVIGLGRVNTDDHDETFCMTVLALKTASQVNGVSRLHGEVSRQMWADLYPGTAVDDVPIGHITNGVHVETFMHPAMRDVVEERMGLDWNEALVNPARWAELSKNVTDEDLYVLRRRLKGSLFAFLRKRFQDHSQSGPRSCAERCLQSLDGWSDEALTVGFARRFATYKRGDLIFGDFERAVRIFQDQNRPFQLVVAGKAHPRDSPGKEVIQRVVHAVNNGDLNGRVLFVEDYDLATGRALVSGVDVWLNNPRRPREASGTSGQKVPLHGGVNLSILDGWWAEGYDKTNGYSIGDHEEPSDQAVQDSRDLEALYVAIENQLLPEYYADEPGRGAAWTARVRRSFETLPAEYGTRRMLRDYANHYYEPITANQR